MMFGRVERQGFLIKLLPSIYPKVGGYALYFSAVFPGFISERKNNQNNSPDKEKRRMLAKLLDEKPNARSNQPSDCDVGKD